MKGTGSPVAVGFDLGETLFTYADTPLSWVDLYPAALATVARACDRTIKGREIAEASAILARYNSRIHPRRDEVTASQIFGDILRTWNVEAASQLEVAIEAFFRFFQQRIRAYPESAAVLHALSVRGVTIGALTDVPYGMPRAFVQRDLAAAGLEPLINKVLTSVEVGFRKPEPAGFEALAAELDVTPDQLWFVGNEEKDIVGARAIGAFAVLIDRDHRRPAWGQDRTISDLGELLVAAN
ncbi:MAG: HAD family hydrolase [Opitutus sp.]